MNETLTPIRPAFDDPLPPDTPELQAKAQRAEAAIREALKLVEEVWQEAEDGSLIHNRAEPAVTELQAALESFTWVPDPE